MTDSVQIKLRQRATIVLKVCELAESHGPETDKAMTPEDELKVDEIYRLLNRASAAGHQLARRLVIAAYRTASG